LSEPSTAFNDTSVLSGLTNLELLSLNSNSIYDITPLIANTGLGDGDTLDLSGNCLKLDSGNDLSNIQALESRGVAVTSDDNPRADCL
jgi:Leucine-rich repeat (LRR) protein